MLRFFEALFLLGVTIYVDYVVVCILAGGLATLDINLSTLTLWVIGSLLFIPLWTKILWWFYDYVL